MAETRKVAVVTGAASGIGRACALLLSSRGYRVVGLDLTRSPSPREPAAAGCDIEWMRCDVSDENQVRRTVRRIHARTGRIDVLVNNAGCVLTRALTKSRWEDFEHLFAVNVGGTFLMCKHVLPYMMRTKSGSIVNVSSISGHVGSVNNVLYCGSKGAVLAFTKSLAVEVAGEKIRVNSVSPGYVDTPMLAEDLRAQASFEGRPPQEVTAREIAGQPFGRFAHPGEVAEAVCFLASDAASFISGTDLVVDSGWIAR